MHRRHPEPLPVGLVEPAVATACHLIGHPEATPPAALVGQLSAVTGTEGDEPDSHLGLVLLSSDGLRGGSSVKPRNLFVNLRRSVVVASETAVGVAGAVAVPWLMPMAAICLIDRLIAGATRQLQELHGALLWVMWQEQEASTVVGEGLVERVNNHLRAHDRAKVSEATVSRALDDLIDLRCIAKRDDTPTWKLRERVVFRTR